MDFEQEEKNVIKNILEDYNTKNVTNSSKNEARFIDRIEDFEEPDASVLQEVVLKLFQIIYPGFFREKDFHVRNMQSYITVLIQEVMIILSKQIFIAIRRLDDNKGKNDVVLFNEARKIVIDFFSHIPKIRELLEGDIDAAFDGDPAAFDKAEIVLSYPGLFAISVNRIAHELFLLKVPLIPRIMTEYAHNKTGIDIHPGATLGKRFFIDHGTGIVIGETTVIGDNVKVYQGVTLGAISTNGGQALKGVKRHPTIEDNVTIYSGASILGGDTIIGKNCVIGGNTFITKSVAQGTVVSIKNQELKFKQKDIGSSF